MMNAADETLLTIVLQSIKYGLKHNKPGTIRTESLPESLLKLGASFVTLTLDGELRGCIGSVKPHRPIAQDVAANAYLAAFQDSRFSPLTATELKNIHFSIMLLSPLEPIDFDDESELITIIRPNIDGLVLQEGDNRGVFLPDMWQNIPDKQSFLNALKFKAGLKQNYWSDSLNCWRFTVRTVESSQ
tara:strand:+ start:37 stop:597 length:561 start_codon:yes stop_codon:yes gene_type:complete